MVRDVQGQGENKNMKEKRVRCRFKLEVANTGLIEIVERVVFNKPEPMLVKFRTPNSDGAKFSKQFEALKQGDILILEFGKSKRKAKP